MVVDTGPGSVPQCPRVRHQYWGRGHLRGVAGQAARLGVHWDAVAVTCGQLDAS